MRFSRSLILLCLPALLLMGVFVLGLVILALRSFETASGWGIDNYLTFLARPDFRAALVRTLLLSLFTTVFSAVIGYPLARTIAKAGRARTFLTVLVILPWMVSIVVRSYGWIVTLGNRGTLNSFMKMTGIVDRPFQFLFNDIGVVIGLVHVFCPFMIIAVLAVLEKADRAYEEASMSLGAPPITTFLRVTLPLVLPGILTGASIIFLLSSGAVLTPLLLGGPRNPTLAVQIYQDIFQLFNFPRAATATMVLMVATLIAILPLYALERRVQRHLPSKR